MDPSQVFIDPMTFKEGELTFILCNDAQGMLGWFIKWFTKDNYCHEMLSRKPGFVCSQNNMYEEVPISNYLKSSEGLKFYRIANLTQDEFYLINKTIDVDLQAPWWQRMYNYPGLIAQSIPWLKNWFSMPYQNICSQRCARYKRLLPRLVPITLEHPSPADEDESVMANPGLLPVLGYWWKD